VKYHGDDFLLNGIDDGDYSLLQRFHGDYFIHVTFHGDYFLLKGFGVLIIVIHQKLTVCTFSKYISWLLFFTQKNSMVMILYEPSQNIFHDDYSLHKRFNDDILYN